MMQRIAVLADLHANLAATAAVLADIKQERPDTVYCLGDLVGYGAFPNEATALIRDRAIPTIMGNYGDGVGFDRDDCGCAYKDEGERQRGQQSLFWTRSVTTDENKAFLCSLAPEIRLDVDGVRLRLVHGSPRRMNECLFEDRDPASLARIARTADCDLLVFEQTHTPWVKTIKGVRSVNGGSVGKPKDGDPRAAWTLLTIDGGMIGIAIRRVDYVVAAMAAAIRAGAGLPDHHARDLETGGTA